MRLLLTCENLQELDDLRLLAQELKMKNAAEIYFFAIPLLYGIKEEDEFKGFDKLIRPFGAKRGNFKFFPLPLKALYGFLNAFYVLSLIYKYKIDLCLTGVSLIYTRLARVLSWNKTIFVSYVRSLLADDNHPTSSSENLWLKLSKLPGHQILEDLAPYQADYVLTIGERNKETLIKKGLKAERVYVVGPIAVDQHHIIKPAVAEINEIVFLMQAFSWHNDEASAKAQNDFLLMLIKQVKGQQGLQLRIRPHPRDTSGLDSSLFNETIVLDKSGGAFLQTLTHRSLLVSAVSTLNFEAGYLGFAHCFFATGAIRERFAGWYQSMSIEPLDSADDVITLAKELPESASVLRSFNDVFESKYRGKSLKVASQLLASLMEVDL